MLEIRQLSKSYVAKGHVVAAVSEVSFALEPGEFVSVQGASGCGKSTLLLMVGGLLAPDRGEVVLNGENPYQMSSEARARYRAYEIGFVFQQFHLIPYLSVRENVMAATVAHPAPAAASRAERLLAELDLQDRLRHLPSELSTGERQRVALARALLNEPKLILADEPTGNLDLEHAGVVLRHLADFAQAGGMVLLVTHDPFAASFAQRNFTMAHGRFVHEPAKAVS
ncbi:MAG TPA: ABC transporter ATP-binding protein [Pirellulales bacterium]|nr:ABC transporter ATP-binding protein [Pirellulales bacterium]